MPDLMLVDMQMCKSIDGPLTVEMRGSHGEMWLVSGLFSERHIPSCTCPAFKFKKKRWCKHIDKAMEEACGWHEQYSLPLQNDKQKKEHICPACGGPTVTVRVAV